jgi:hypothetical protein
MFFTIFSLEIKRAFRSPMLYIFIFLLAFMCFMAVVSDSVVIGGSIGAVHKNAPHIVTVFTGVLSLIGILFAVAFFNNAALRDYQHQFDEIIFTTPLSKAAYFFGRFFGACILASTPFIGVYIGVSLGAWIAPIFDWVPAERFGPTPWAAYWKTYLLIVLPNVFFSGSLIFGLAQKWRSTIVSFVGALLIIIGYIISGNLLSDIENVEIAALTDPFGVRTYSVETRYATTVEKNTQSIDFTARIVQNRLLWLAVGSGILLLSFWSFSPQKNPSRKRKAKKVKAKIPELSSGLKHKPKLEQGFSGKFWSHFISFLKDAYTSIVRSTVFKIILAFAVILLATDLINGFEYFGLKSYPLTYKMVDAISGSSGIFMIIILVFFSGELVWRARLAHIDEVISATPHQAFSQLLAQWMALVAAGTILYGTFVVAAILAQLARGFTFIEMDLYIGEYFLNQLPNFLVFGALNLFIQVMVNQRYLAYFISVLVLFLFDILLSILDVQSNMLSIGDGPSTFYSDLNGYGPGLTGAFWFNAYWISFSLLLLFIAGPFMYRLKVQGLASRWSQARNVFKGSYRISTLVTTVLFVVIGAWVYYNTQVLNTYRTSDEVEELLADYEKKYRAYADYPSPKISAISYAIDLFPKERRVEVEAQMTLSNSGKEVIDSLFFTLDDDWQTEISGKLDEAWFDEKFGFKAFALNEPLAPGKSIQLTIKNTLEHRGFENGRGSTSIIENGSFLNNGAVLPNLGYNKNAELGDRNTRKKYGLRPKDRMPELVRDTCTEACMVNYLTDGLSDWVAVETVISTSADQLAIAPGELIEEWQEGDRRYFRYRVDQASQNFYSFISGRYEKAQRKWKGIDLEVYYDAKHEYNVERMLDAIQKSLAYYTEHFGPYYHKQARIIEFPRYATFAQAFPGTMPYSEGFGFITNLEDEEGNNVVDAVIAHEMAHQWWAHQEIPALMQGGTFLTESFSEYSSLMVMKSESDPIQMREFLKYDIDRYLRGRSSETEKELPLLEVENQGYIHYGKGSVILYALQEMIGQDSVNAALSSFLAEYRYKNPPYPNSLDFMRHLEPRVPDSLHYLLDDWIRKITLYDFRLKEAEQISQDGQWQVSLELESFKYYSDTLGQEQPTPVNEWVEIGFYRDSEEKELIKTEMVKVNKESQELVFTLNQPAQKVAVDPRRIYIERVVNDNVKRLEDTSEE